jgi:hypothetical protein
MLAALTEEDAIKTSQIDALKPVPRFLAWAAWSLLILLIVAVMEYFSSGTFAGWRAIVPFVIVGAAVGSAGSAYRTRHPKLPQQVTRYTKNPPR